MFDICPDEDLARQISLRGVDSVLEEGISSSSDLGTTIRITAQCLVHMAHNEGFDGTLVDLLRNAFASFESGGAAFQQDTMVLLWRIARFRVGKVESPLENAVVEVPERLLSADFRLVVARVARRLVLVRGSVWKFQTGTFCQRRG
jgi:hypothetical protein